MTMNGTRRILLSLLFLAASSSGAREVALTILHTTDMHGHILPPIEMSPPLTGSLLRAATLIAEIRSNTPNVLLVDCGDAIQGSAESWLTRGRIVARAMEWLRYDAWVPGNHDFDWGVKNLDALQRSIPVPPVAANIRFASGAANGLPGLKPFILRDVDGIRVAIVGLTTPGIPTWLRQDKLGGAEFLRSVSALSRTMPQLRQARPDAMILLVHQGFLPGGDDHANEIRRIAARFPEFDVMLGGHLHWTVPGMRLGNPLYAQSGNYAQGLGRVDLVYDTIRKCVTRKTSDVLPVDASCAPSVELEALLADDLARATQYLGEAVGSTEYDLDASLKLPGDSPIQQLFCAAIAKAVKAEAVIHGILSSETIPAGPILRRDVWRIVPYENDIGVASLNTREIKEILEVAAELGGTGHFMAAYGLAYEIHAYARPGNRIQNIAWADGTAIHPKTRLRVAFNSHTLASAGNRYRVVRDLVEQPNARLEMTRIDTRTAVEKYIRSNSPLKIKAGTGIQVVTRNPKRKKTTPKSGE